MNKNENTQLCPNCQTGLESYLLDKQSPVCPYIGFHDGEKCLKFRMLSGAENQNN